MPHRPYFKTPVAEMEKIFKKHVRDQGVLGDLYAELTHRKTERAKQLRKEVEGALTGEIPIPPKPPRPAHPDDQMDLIDEE